MSQHRTFTPVVKVFLHTLFCLSAILCASTTFSQKPEQPLADATSSLLAILGHYTSIQGAFTQVQYDVNSDFMGESSGRFRMLRPGYFSWKIESPDDQLIVANPSYIWHFDKDLETVTRRHVTDTSAMSPLQILGGNEALLRTQFRVEKNLDNLYTLTPLAEQSTFNHLSLRVEKDIVVGMEIIDTLNQRLVIDFNDIDTKSMLREEDFAFAPPEGVDLFYYDE